MKLSIVIPAHNEGSSLPITLAGLIESVNVPCEILVVDDHSTDTTSAVVLDFAKRHRNIRLLTNDAAPGFTNATKKGFSQVKEGAVVLVMADACDDPTTINHMYNKIIEGFDVVCGSRYTKGGKKLGGRFLQTLFSRLGGLSFHFLFGIPTYDVSNAFKMYRKEAIDSIEIEEAGFASSLEILVKLHCKGYKIAEVPTVWRDRVAGNSNFRLWKVIKNYLRWYLWALFMEEHKRR